jgi:capsular exopolysaccharide synthesis family protein
MGLLTYAFDEDGFKVETYVKGIRSFYASAGISVEQILLEMSRRNPAALDADSKTVFALKQGENLAGVPWFPKELAILGELDGTASIEILTQSTGIEEPAVRKILAVFSRLGIIEEIGDGRTPGSSPESEPSSPIRKSEFAFERLVPFVSNAVFSDELEVIRNPSSFISEQFKTLKVRIRQDHPNPPRVLTISSPEQQDGKSLVSANFAVALAMEEGRRTVIVDCDLRSPSLDKYLGVTLEPGLIQHLSNGRFLPHCCMRRVGNLYFMTSGGISQSPTEMLSVRKMKELVESLRKDFDTVILDAPPYSPIADAQIISGLSDGVIMVIRSGKTSKSNIEHAFKVIDKKKLLGVVFNDVEPTLLHSYYHRYQYAYGNDSRSEYAAKRRLKSTPTKGYLDS